MEAPFVKMQGLGNDFILINCKSFPPPEGFDIPAFAKKVCHRRFGVGADQLLLLYPSSKADFKMRVFNADGGEVEMCGNGIRCLARYIWDRRFSKKETLAIETLAGIIRPEDRGELVKVDMGEPIFDPEKIPMSIKFTSFPVVDYPVQIKGREFRITCISMGNPHAVIFLSIKDGEELSNFSVPAYGPEIERHPLFPKKTNVEFVDIESETELSIRVWERGAGETMACGTGASAAGVASMLKGLTRRAITVHLRGGDLFIEWAENNHVYMTGPASEVFEGRIRI